MIWPHVGDLIELIRMDNDPDPVPVGTLGLVTKVNRYSSPSGSSVGTIYGQISVEWENGRTLSLLQGVDRFKVL